MAGRSVEIAINARDNASKQMADVERSSKGLIGTLGKLRGVVGSLGLGIGAGAAGYALVHQLKSSAMAFADAQLKSAKLESVLRSTGYAAGLSGNQIRSMANEFERLTAFDADDIIGAQSILATFKNIKGDTFRQASGAMLDLATVMGKDLPNAALMLGKALNDPSKGMSALGRVGVQFSNEQEASIKKLLSQGKLIKAQEVILQQFTTTMGGAASAALDTFSGKIDRLARSWENLKESAGGAMSGPLGRMMDLMAGGFDKVSSLDEPLQGNDPWRRKPWNGQADAMERLRELNRQFQGAADTTLEGWRGQMKRGPMGFGKLTFRNDRQDAEFLETLNVFGLMRDSAKVQGGKVGQDQALAQIKDLVAQMKENQGKQGVGAWLAGGLQDGIGRAGKGLQDFRKELRGVLEIFGQMRHDGNAAFNVIEDQLRVLANKGAEMVEVFERLSPKANAANDIRSYGPMGRLFGEGADIFNMWRMNMINGPQAGLMGAGALMQFGQDMPWKNDRERVFGNGFEPPSMQRLTNSAIESRFLTQAPFMDREQKPEVRKLEEIAKELREIKDLHNRQVEEMKRNPKVAKQIMEMRGF